MINKVLNKQIGINKTTILNLLSTVVLQGIAFLTIPIFTRVLGSDQFGLYAVYNSWVAIISVIISLGIGSCVGPGKYFYKDEYYNFRNNIIVFNTLTCIIVSIIFVKLYFRISTILSYRYSIYIILLLTAFSTNTINLIASILIFEKKALMNLVLSIFLSATSVLLSLFLIYNFNFANLYEGRVYGHFFPYCISALILIIYIVFMKPFKIDFKYLKYGLAVGTPVLFHQIAHYILGQSDRIMMQKLGTTPSNVGIYSLFYSFCGVLTIILGALNTSYNPFYFEYIDNNDKDIIINKSKNLIELFTVICIGFLLLSREVSYVMADSEYYSGINLIPIFVGSVYFNFLYLFPVNYEFFYRRTKTIAVGTIGAAILNIILNYYYINKYGMFGAAYSTLISYGVLFVFHFIIANLMQEKRFYIYAKYYVFGLCIIVLFSYSFYALSSFAIYRWLIGVIIGVFELYRIVKRKVIF